MTSRQSTVSGFTFVAALLHCTASWSLECLAPLKGGSETPLVEEGSGFEPSRDYISGIEVNRDGSLFIDTDDHGWLAVNANGIDIIDGSKAAGIVNQIMPPGDQPRFVGTEAGLYMLEGSRIVPVQGGAAAGRIKEIMPADDDPRFVVGVNGMFRIEDDRLIEVARDEEIDYRFRILRTRGKPTFVVMDKYPYDELYRIKGNQLIKVDSFDGDAFTDFGAAHVGDRLLVATDKGVYWVDSESETLVDIDFYNYSRSPGFRTHSINGIPRFVENNSDLYRIDGNRLTHLGPTQRIGSIKEIVLSDDDRHFVLAEWGFFRIEGDELVRFGGRPPVPRPIVDLGPADDDPRLVIAGNGLFRIEGDNAVLLDGGDAAGEIYDIGTSRDDPRLVKAENGLFKIEGDSLVLLEGGDAGGRILDIGAPEDDPRLVIARKGLFRIEGDSLLEMIDGSINWIRPDKENTRLVSSSSGLYRLEGLETFRFDGSDESGDIFLIRPQDENPRLVGALNGLFKLDGDRLASIAGSSEVSHVKRIGSADEDPRFVVTHWGVYRYFSNDEPVSNIVEEQNVLQTTHHTFRWEVDSECFAVSSAFFSAVVGDEQIDYAATAYRRPDSHSLRLEATVPIDAEDGETVVAFLKYRQTENEEWRDVVNSKRTVKVNWGPTDHLRDWIERFGVILALGHAAVFGGLLLSSSRSSRAWKVLSDPILNKSFLWFWFALRHLPILQLWPLARWFENVGSRTEVPPYVHLPLTDSDDRPLSTEDLAVELRSRPRIWLQGNTGMGKTALVGHLAGNWFLGNEKYHKSQWSLKRAIQEYGYIHLPIRLRDHSTVPIPKAPEDWIFELASREFARSGLPIGDNQLLKGIVTSGKFMLFLDGANEVDDSGAIQQFALRYPDVGMFVTSQTLPDIDATQTFHIWRLPPSIESVTSQLLHAWLESNLAAATAKAISKSPIRRDIRSGYDVRLMADLVEGGIEPYELPETRMGLYEAMLAKTKQYDGTEYPLAELCEVSWKAWASGARHFLPGDTISRALVDPLLAQGVRVMRQVRDGYVEFRHDQMRGYLAARWAANHEVSPLDLLEQTKGIWRFRRSEQQTVWNFLSEMIDEKTGSKLLEWSETEAERAELQVALRRVARREHWGKV